MNSLHRPVRRAATLIGVGACALGLVGASSALASAAQHSTKNIGPFTQEWTKELPDAGKPIALASPTVATLDDQGPAVIVGDRKGFIYAFHTSDGSEVAGWPYSTGGIAVDSTPSVVGSGPSAVVYVGVGNSANNFKGGYLKLSAQGKKIWSFKPLGLPGKGSAGVQGSLSIGTMQGKQVVAAGPMGQEQYVLNAATGKPIAGWPWYQADTNFTTYALADLYHTGSDVLIEGGDATHGISYGRWYSNGGHLRILGPTGNHGTKNPAGGIICDYETDQVVQSSPAVGRILAGGKNGIAFGTGTFYAHAAMSKKLTVVNDRCRKVWQKKLDGTTTSSPMFIDNLGTGELNVVEATKINDSSSGVYAFHGANGKQIWHTHIADGTVYGSPVSISLDGSHQDVLVPTTGGLYVLDGRTGAILYHLHDGLALQNAPVVSVEADGSVGVTVAGYRVGAGGLHGSIEHYRVGGAPAASVTAAGSWPMFHHDLQLRGNTGTVAVSSAATRKICSIRLAGCKKH